MDTMDSTFIDKRILITGGVGFIGSNLACKHVELGAELTLVNSLFPEYGGNLFNFLIKSIAWDSGFEN